MFFDRFCIFATSLCILPACAGVNLTDAMRQRIYEMWISGYKVANIAADIGVNAHTVKSELERGYTGDIYIGGRKVYDPDRASAIAKMVKAGRPPVRIVPPVVLGKEPRHD